MGAIRFGVAIVALVGALALWPVREASINSDRHSTAIGESVGPLTAPHVGGGAPAGTVGVAAVGSTTWLGEINRYRVGSGLSPVTANATWVRGIQAHLTYLALSPPSDLAGAYQSLHTENPASPYYTATGALEASRSDLTEGAVGDTPVEFIDSWLSAPFHALGLLRPGLRQVAFASDPTTGDAGIDVIGGLTASVPTTSPVLFPGNGMVTNLTTLGPEVPDPTSPCGWTQLQVGLPILAVLPASPPSGVGASITGPSGSESTAGGTVCVVDVHTFNSATAVYGPSAEKLLSGTHLVIVIPRSPLVAGSYHVQITMSGAAPLTSTFSVTSAAEGIGAPASAPETRTQTIVGMAATPTGAGYWLAAANGMVRPFGAAGTFGSMADKDLVAPITHIVATPDGRGYWLVAADGGTFAFGDAGFYGSMGGQPLNAPVVDLAPTADGRGYWLVASDGGVFAFGDAQFDGSMGDKPLDRPVVGVTPEVSGGYREVALDGGIFSFGAPFFGSMGGRPLVAPINGMEPTPSGMGYWMVASDGGVFAFGDAAFHGSMGGMPLDAPIVGLAVDPATGGYWMVASDGGVFAFDAPFLGSLA